MPNTRRHSSLPDDPECARYARVVGDNVRRLRASSGINKTTFCMMCGIGRPTLDQIERGTNNTRLSLLVDMAGALGTTPEALLSEPPEDAGRGYLR